MARSTRRRPIPALAAAVAILAGCWLPCEAEARVAGRAGQAGHARLEAEPAGRSTHAPLPASPADDCHGATPETPAPVPDHDAACCLSADQVSAVKPALTSAAVRFHIDFGLGCRISPTEGVLGARSVEPSGPASGPSRHVRFAVFRI
jgi:hypothetical protein